MIKNSQGGHGYKMGIQCFRLAEDVDYTLCIEILITDYIISCGINREFQLIRLHQKD